MHLSLGTSLGWEESKRQAPALAPGHQAAEILDGRTGLVAEARPFNKRVSCGLIVGMGGFTLSTNVHTM